MGKKKLLWPDSRSEMESGLGTGLIKEEDDASISEELEWRSKILHAVAQQRESLFTWFLQSLLLPIVMLAAMVKYWQEADNQTKCKAPTFSVGLVQEVVVVVDLGDLLSGKWELKKMEVIALQSNWPMRSTGMILLSLSLCLC